MDIDIQIIPLHLHTQRNKREFMLHQKAFVRVLNGFGDDIVLDITTIDVIILKRTVSPRDLRFSDKAGDLHERILLLDFEKRFGDIPAIHTVDHIFDTVVAGSMQLDLFILDVFKRDRRMRKCKLFHQGMDIIRLCCI